MRFDQGLSFTVLSFVLALLGGITLGTLCDSRPVANAHLVQVCGAIG